MKDNIINPPEKAPNFITTVADQGQGGLEAKTRSNSTTQSSIALTKDNPAITTPKRSSKRFPSETVEDGAMLGRSLFSSEVAQGQDDNPPDPTTSKSQRKQPPPSKTAKDGAVQGRSPVAYVTKLKVSQFCRLYKTAWRQEVFALATAQRVITTDEKSPHFWEFSLVFDPTLIVRRAEPLTWMWRTASEFFANPWTVPAIIPHIVEEFERLKREPTIAKAQSKFKKRLASTPA
ncbi:unnamed protein product, partial [Cylindrotheca closterium]